MRGFKVTNMEMLYDALSGYSPIDQTLFRSMLLQRLSRTLDNDAWTHHVCDVMLMMEKSWGVKCTTKRGNYERKRG